MTRLVGIVLAALFGGTALLLLAGPVSASYPGGTAACTTVVNVAAVEAPAPVTRRDRVEATACHEALVHRTELVGLAALGCVVAGSGVAFGGRRQPAYATSVRHSLSS